MDDLFAIEFNGKFIATYLRRGNARAAFNRCMYRINPESDLLRMIGFPSGYIYCEN